MNRLPLVVAALFILIFSGIGCAPTAPLNTPTEAPTLTEPETISTSSNMVQATVVGVVDGDTIDVNIGDRQYRVRYIGVDTPERGQYGYDEATLVNARLVSNKVVELEKDVSETDRYGRLLRYVWGEGEIVNAVLVARGYAQVATYPPDVKYQNHFLELQHQAQADGLGLWATPQTIQETQGLYVGSVNSDKYHYPSCQYAQQILPQNRIWFLTTAEAQASGYIPCKVCRPPDSG